MFFPLTLAWHGFVFVRPVPAGPMYTITVPLSSYGAWGQRPPPLVHYNSHYHALLFPVTVNQLTLRGKWRGNSSLDTYSTVQSEGVVSLMRYIGNARTHPPKAALIQDLFSADSV